MSITIQGINGEQMARLVIKKWGIDELFQLDWMAKYKDKYICFEIKHKEWFTPPPCRGQGLDVRQVKARIKLYKETGIRCLFMVFPIPEDGYAYCQWLDILESGNPFTTRNRIRIYDMSLFQKYKIKPKNAQGGADKCLTGS